MISPEEKSQLFAERNKLLEDVNDFLARRKYLEVVLLLEDAIAISMKIGEKERVSEYYLTISECIEKSKALLDEIEILDSDGGLKAAILKERREAIAFAQEAAQHQQFQKAIESYRRAIEFSLKLNDKKTVWKLSKNISLLEQKIPPSPQVVSSRLSEKKIEIPHEEVKPKLPPIVQEAPRPQIKAFIPEKPKPKPPPIVQEAPRSVIEAFVPEKPKPKIPIIEKKPPAKPVVKKEIPFFTPPIEKQETELSAEVGEEEVKDIFETEDKKLKRKLKLAEKIALKKLEDAEKKYKKTSDKDEKKKEKELKKKEKEEPKVKEKEEPKVKKKEKEEKEKKEKEEKEKKEKEEKKAKKKEKKVKIKEKPDSKFSSPLPSDVLSEIRGFKQEKLEDAPAETKEKKKPVAGRALLPADVLEELRKKTDKRSE